MMQSSKAVFNNSSDSENNCTSLNYTQASSSKHLFYDTDEESYSSTSMPFSVESEEDFVNLFRILAKLVKTLVSLPIDYKKGQVPKIVLQPLKYDLSEKHVLQIRKLIKITNSIVIPGHIAIDGYKQ